jgi:hypothetical protein
MTEQTHTPPKKSKSAKVLTKKMQRIMSGAAVVLVAAIVTIVIMKSQPLQAIDSSKFQVVYLTNGQAYFGKLQNTSGDFLIMKSPYITQSVANSDDETSTDTQTTLLKVTDQLYGPDDSIAIKASQVTFWQNLRDDSKVSQAMKSKE